MNFNQCFRLLLSISFLFFGFAIRLSGKPSRPNAKLTGGFGESTCLHCHSSHQLNEGRILGGDFEIEGIPAEYEAGKRYNLTIRMAHPGQSRWGFELSARSAHQASQAGQLIAVDSNTHVKEEDGISYIMHANAGSRSVADRASFSFIWIAPESAAGIILFNAAGNAANANDEPVGDYVYTAGGFSTQVKGAEEITEAEVEEVEVATGTRLNETPIFFNLPAPIDLKKSSFEIHIQHRFFQSLEDSEPGNAFGIDSGANINLGLNYAITDKLSAGISRARIDQIISLTATHEIHSDNESWWKMSLHGGVAGKRNFEQQYSPFLQLATSFDYRVFRLYLAPTIVFNSRDDTQGLQPGSGAVNPDKNNTFSLGIGADVALHRRFSIIGEYVPRLAGFGGFFRKHDQLGGGVAIRTWGHVFTVVASRSRDLSPTQYAVGSDLGAVSLGFNIYRRID